MEEVPRTSRQSCHLGAWDYHLHDPLAHRLLGFVGRKTSNGTFAGGDHVIILILGEGREVDVGDGARVTVAGQGDVLSRGFRGHGLCENRELALEGLRDDNGTILERQPGIIGVPRAAIVVEKGSRVPQVLRREKEGCDGSQKQQRQQQQLCVQKQVQCLEMLLVVQSVGGGMVGRM